MLTLMMLPTLILLIFLLYQGRVRHIAHRPFWVVPFLISVFTLMGGSLLNQEKPVLVTVSIFFLLYGMISWIVIPRAKR